MLLDRDTIVECLGELGDLLGDDGAEHVVVLVGGALMALRGLRESTRDVDTIERVEDELERAVAEVAHHRGLPPKWLNARAAAFKPVTFDQSACTPVLSRGRLTVLAAPLSQVFLMKLRAGRAPDYEDMIRLWPDTGYANATAAVEAFWRAYPEEPEDPEFLGFVEGITHQADSV